jgi:hypothetical protein
MTKEGAESKHNYDAVVSIIKQTTCFGPCTGPSSGLNLRVGGDYTVRVSLKKSVSLQGQRDLVALRYSHVCKAITSAKQCTTIHHQCRVWVQLI